MPETIDPKEELAKVDSAIEAQEKLWGVLPNQQVKNYLQLLQEKRRLIQSQLKGGGAIAQGKGAIETGGSILGVITSSPLNAIVQNWGYTIPHRSASSPMAPVPALAWTWSVMSRNGRAVYGEKMWKNLSTAIPTIPLMVERPWTPLTMSAECCVAARSTAIVTACAVPVAAGALLTAVSTT